MMNTSLTSSNRIESFEITDEEGRVLYRGSTVGYKKIAVFPAVEVKELHIRILDSRICPTLAFIGVY